MDWIKIEPGCEMPAEGERVLVFAGTWEEAECEGGLLCYIDGEEIGGVTHWMRVTPPA
ncbi:hypothetical protein [Pseudoxanthomonas winnipegensis]|uniref:hypothetical protein n=1 Tax=Pseudoxanthomonas winnipegensis TaxID=2480810 RepID=UPI0013EE53AC|nr:hypothetical protein [Pseudoxanthomonas winnipegensis]